MGAGTSSVNSRDLCQFLKTSRNPFYDDKVYRVSDGIIDVSQIHEDVYRKLKRELEEVRRTARSRGVLIKGVAGSGKSHMLARLFHGRDKDVVFFQIEPLPGEATGWLKHILQCIVQNLQQPPLPGRQVPQLTTLINHLMNQVGKSLKKRGGGTNLDALDGAVENMIRQISNEIADPLVHDVLKALVNTWRWGVPFGPDKEERNKKIFLTARWLKGCMIDDDELSNIGLTQNLGEDVQAGDQAYLTALRVIGMLTRGQAPIVLAFDQLDSMSDPTINAFGNQLLHLIGADSAAPNYLIVTAGIQEQVEKFARENIISQGALDVLFKTELELQALRPADCENIVKARLQTALPEEFIGSIPTPGGSLFPLTPSCIEERLAGPVAPSPRRVLKVAGSLFEEVQEQINQDWLRQWPDVVPIRQVAQPSEPPTSEKIDAFLSAELDIRIRQAQSALMPDPIDGDLLVQTVISLVELTAKEGPFRVLPLPSGPYQKPASAFASIGLCQQPSFVGAFLVENRGHWSTVNASLTRLIHFCNTVTSPERLFLVRDKRAKSVDGWKKPAQRLEELTATKRFVRIDLSSSEVISLTAMDSLRKDQPDLIVPPSKCCREYQVTKTDVAGFLIRQGRLENHSLFSAAKVNLSDLMTKPSGDQRKSPEQPEPAPPGPRPHIPVALRDIMTFIYTRMQVRPFYSYEHCLVEWVNHFGRVTPTEDDRGAFRAAVEELRHEGKILLIGEQQQILKRKPSLSGT